MTQTSRLNLFTSHPRAWGRNLYVYPVVSRRSKGLSIGVNLNPDKGCNFDCIYCSVDRNVPGAITYVDLNILRRELSQMVDMVDDGAIWQVAPFDTTPQPLRRFNDVAFSGDGEPTSSPQFGEACRLVADVLGQRLRSESVKIILITNATLLHVSAVQQALRFLDEHNGEIWAKLEAGTEEFYRRVERTKIPLQRVLENLLETGRIRPIVIQSLFMKIHDESPPADEIDAYLERLRELRDAGCKIKLVQVYTVARQTTERYVTPLDASSLDAITDRVRKLGLNAESFYGPA